jgi:acyl carrier protein
MDLRAKLVAIIAEIGEVDDPSVITDTADLYKEVGIDSMQALEIMLELEKQLGVEVSEAKLKEIRTLGDALRVVRAAGVKE